MKTMQGIRRPYTITELMEKMSTDSIIAAYKRFMKDHPNLGGKMNPDDLNPSAELPPMRVSLSFTLSSFKAADLKEIRPRAEVTIAADECKSVSIIAGGKEYVVSHDQFVEAASKINDQFC